MLAVNLALRRSWGRVQYFPWGNWNLSCIVNLTNDVQIREITAMRRLASCILPACRSWCWDAPSSPYLSNTCIWTWIIGKLRGCRSEPGLVALQCAGLGSFPPAHTSVTFCTSAMSMIEADPVARALLPLNSWQNYLIFKLKRKQFVWWMAWGETTGKMAVKDGEGEASQAFFFSIRGLLQLKSFFWAWLKWT